MKIKILKIYEQNNILRVETECEFGKDNLGLSQNAKYKDPLTDKPKYLKEVKSLLENKYQKQLAQKKTVDKDMWNKTIDLDKV